MRQNKPILIPTATIQERPLMARVRHKYIVGPLALNVKIMNQKQHKVNASQGEELIYV